jgi:hypothetical protein
MNRPTLKSEAARLGQPRSTSSPQTTVRTYCSDRQIVNEILRDIQNIGIPADAIVVTAVREANLPTEMKEKRRGVQTSLLVGFPIGALVGLTIALISMPVASAGGAGWNPWAYFLGLFTWSAVSALFFAGFAAILTFGLRKLSPNPANDKPGSPPYVVEVRCRLDQVEQVQGIFQLNGSMVRE